jgi:hypothetical protein
MKILLLKNLPALRKIVYGVFLLISIIFSCVFMLYYLRFKQVSFAEINQTYLIEKNYIFYSITFIGSAWLFSLYNLYDRDRI